MVLLKLKLRILVVVFAILALAQMSDAKPGRGRHLSSLEAEDGGSIHERSLLRTPIPCNDMLDQQCRHHCVQWKFNSCEQSEPDASQYFVCTCSSYPREASQSTQREENGEQVNLESFKEEEMTIEKSSTECTPITEGKCYDLCTDPTHPYKYEKQVCTQKGNPKQSGFKYCACYNPQKRVNKETKIELAK